MRKPMKKLVLSRETLRQLDDQALRALFGGDLITQGSPMLCATLSAATICNDTFCDCETGSCAQPCTVSCPRPK